MGSEMCIRDRNASVPAATKPSNLTLVTAVAVTPVLAVLAFTNAATSLAVDAAATETVEEPIYPLIVRVSVSTPLAVTASSAAVPVIL